MNAIRITVLALAVLGLGWPQKRGGPRPPEVLLVEISAHRGEGVVSVDGRVKNGRATPIRGLNLILEFQAPGGEVITTKNQTVAEELGPGEESEFRWQLVDPVRAVRFKVMSKDAGDRDLRVDRPGPYTIE